MLAASILSPQFIAGVIIVIVILCIIGSCIRIVPQAHAVIVERLGGYLTTWSVGVHIKMPFVDHVARNVILKEQVVDFDPQPVITKDNVTMLIDTVVFYQITDPKLYAYGVENPLMAIENLTATTLRNIIGEMELDETLTSRETINTKMRSSLDEATDPWGIKVNRVELKNIAPPSDIQNSMEKQAKAERDKRAAILSAEGEKQSAILRAEGKKQSAILDAEAEKQAAILRPKFERVENILQRQRKRQCFVRQKVKQRQFAAFLRRRLMELLILRKQRLMQPFFRLRVWRLLRRQLTVKQQRSLCRQIWLRLQEH